MGPESKGRAWLGKIYNKLETILAEVDSFTSQSTLCLKPSDLPEFESVRGEPKEATAARSSVTYNVKQHHYHVASPRCESSSDPPSHQNLDIPGHVLVEERVQGDILKENVSASSFPDGKILSASPLLEEDCEATLGDEEQLITDEESHFLSDGETLSTSPLLEEYHDSNLTSATTVGAEEPIVTDEESRISNTLIPQKFSDQPKEVTEDSSSKAFIVQQHHGPVDPPSYESPTDTLVEKRVRGNIFKENLVQEDNFEETSSGSSLSDKEIQSTSPLLEEYCDANLTSDTTLGDKERIITKSRITNTLTTHKFSAGSSSVFPGGESVEEVRVESSLPDGEILPTSPLVEEYCDANLTSAATLGDEETIITDDKSWITNTLKPHKVFAGNPSVSPGGENVEEDRDKTCRDIVSTESQSTQSSMENFGTVVECNDDPVLPVLPSPGFFTDNDSNQNDPPATKIPAVPVQDNVANMRSSNTVSVKNPDAVINGKSDVAPLDINALHCIEFREDPSYVDNNAMRFRAIAPLDTNALYSMESREDPLYVDDSVLYAMHLRTKKLRSFKKKILDALTSKRRREKEYEQLAIWFGDADMGSDLVTEEDSKQVEAMDSKSSQLVESEDSQWELL